MFACKEKGDFDVRSNITEHVQLGLIGWLLTVLHVCFFGLTIKSLAYTVLVSELGLTGVPVFNTNNNCSSASSALMLARLLVLSGQYECVLALGKVKCISRYHPITCKSTVMGRNLGFYKVCLLAFIMTSPYYNHGTLAARFILGKSQSAEQTFFSCVFHSKRPNNKIMGAGGERKNEERIKQLFLFAFFPRTFPHHKLIWPLFCFCPASSLTFCAANKKHNNNKKRLPATQASHVFFPVFLKSGFSGLIFLSQFEKLSFLNNYTRDMW